MIFRYPVDYIAITQKYIASKHYGIDLGWSSAHSGKNQAVFAARSGIVYSIKDNDASNESWGNYVKIKHDESTYTLYAHLKDGISVNVGDVVNTGDLIGYMGNTGNALGNHLHFEIYIGGPSTQYRVDPLPLTYVYPNQILSSGDTQTLVNYYYPITSSVLRDENKEQVRILKLTLRVRELPNLNSLILGFAPVNAIYNILEKIQSEQYTWYKIGANNYIANVAGYVELLDQISSEKSPEEIKEKGKTKTLWSRIISWFKRLFKIN